MTSTRDPVDVVLAELVDALARVSRDELATLAARLDVAERVFVVGAGRSGLVARAFAMRLLHLGVDVHVVGETTTPSVASGDVVVAVSGSGTTASTVRAAEQAVAAGATLHTVTADPGSALAATAEVVVTVPSATARRGAGGAGSVQPLASLFDQATFVVLDAVCLDLAHHRGVDDTTLRERHSNMD